MTSNARRRRFRRTVAAEERRRAEQRKMERFTGRMTRVFALIALVLIAWAAAQVFQVGWFR